MKTEKFEDVFPKEKSIYDTSDQELTIITAAEPTTTSSGNNTKLISRDSFAWIYDKVMIYFTILILGLLLLNLFEVITLQMFTVGLYSGLALSFAIIGHSFWIFKSSHDEHNPAQQSWRSNGT